MPVTKKAVLPAGSQHFNVMKARVSRRCSEYFICVLEHVYKISASLCHKRDFTMQSVISDSQRALSQSNEFIKRSVRRTPVDDQPDDDAENNEGDQDAQRNPKHFFPSAFSY